MRYLACLDVDYRPAEARAAAVLFEGWESPEPLRISTFELPCPAAYEPGAFYTRELPPLLAVLERVQADLAAVIVDGYVWLDRNGRPGLGARLHEALGSRLPIVGVAKSAFRADDFSSRVLRGGSRRPLYVTAAGMDQHAAADAVRSMHGEHRLPTMLRRADAACRGRTV